MPASRGNGRVRGTLEPFSHYNGPRPTVRIKDVPQVVEKGGGSSRGVSCPAEPFYPLERNRHEDRLPQNEERAPAKRARRQPARHERQRTRPGGRERVGRRSDKRGPEEGGGVMFPAQGTVPWTGHRAGPDAPAGQGVNRRRVGRRVSNVRYAAGSKYLTATTVNPPLIHPAQWV